jgi:hypothetical protein
MPLSVSRYYLPAAMLLLQLLWERDGTIPVPPPPTLVGCYEDILVGPGFSGNALLQWGQADREGASTR